MYIYIYIYIILYYIISYYIQYQKAVMLDPGRPATCRPTAGAAASQPACGTSRQPPGPAGCPAAC